MIRTIGKFKEVSIVCLALAVLAPGFAAGQQGKGGSSTDELLKSIGLTKPAFARAPDFNLRDGAGGMASLSGNRGNLILLNFWATWCGPCREEMPSMEQLSRSFGGQGFTVLAVNQRESAGQVERYMKNQRPKFSRAPRHRWPGIGLLSCLRHSRDVFDRRPWSGDRHEIRHARLGGA